MRAIYRVLVSAALLLAAPVLMAQVKESEINKQLSSLRSLSVTQRPVATLKLAQQIATLPAGQPKVRLAYNLANLATEGDQGQETLQGVTDTLAKSLAESPVPAKGDHTPEPYVELAKLVRYENVTATLNDPLFAKASQVLIDDDADVQKADFMLKDLKGKKYTLSELRGKVVMVNFWATWCPPCRMEMPDLDVIYRHFEPQGLVVLSITDENAFKVSSFISPTGYHPPVLLDPDGKVHTQFHIDGIPKTFIFDRNGKLVAETIDQCTQRQFLKMLSLTDLHN
jgi:thiol-disulfide isomerase/thioredoxin